MIYERKLASETLKGKGGKGKDEKEPGWSDADLRLNHAMLLLGLLSSLCKIVYVACELYYRDFIGHLAYDHEFSRSLFSPRAGCGCQIFVSLRFCISLSVAKVVPDTGRALEPNSRHKGWTAKAFIASSFQYLFDPQESLTIFTKYGEIALSMLKKTFRVVPSIFFYYHGFSSMVNDQLFGFVLFFSPFLWIKYTWADERRQAIPKLYWRGS